VSETGTFVGFVDVEPRNVEHIRVAKRVDGELVDRGFVGDAT
jgi:hypothetical protein